MALGYCTVRVNVGALIIDGVDDNDEFDDVPVAGNMVLTPMLDPGKPVQVDDNGVMKLKAIAPFTVDIGLSGDVSHRGRNYVKVPAPTSATSNLSKLQWRASFNGLKFGLTPVSLPQIFFWAEPGADVNLADHINVGPSSTSMQLSRGPRGAGIKSVEVDGSDLVFRSDAEQSPEISRVPFPHTSVDTIDGASNVGRSLMRAPTSSVVRGIAETPSAYELEPEIDLTVLFNNALA